MWLTLLGGTVAVMVAGAGALFWALEKVYPQEPLSLSEWECWKCGHELSEDERSRARESILREMADKELISLMEDIVRESRRRRRCHGL